VVGSTPSRPNVRLDGSFSKGGIIALPVNSVEHNNDSVLLLSRRISALSLVLVVPKYPAIKLMRYEFPLISPGKGYFHSMGFAKV